VKVQQQANSCTALTVTHLADFRVDKLFKPNDKFVLVWSHAVSTVSIFAFDDWQLRGQVYI